MRVMVGVVRREGVGRGEGGHGRGGGGGRGVDLVLGHDVLLLLEGAALLGAAVLEPDLHLEERM